MNYINLSSPVHQRRASPVDPLVLRMVSSLESTLQVSHLMIFDISHQLLISSLIIHDGCRTV